MEFRKNFESFESLLWEPETALRGNVKNLALSNWTQLAIYQRDGSLALMTGPLRLSIALYLAQEELSTPKADTVYQAKALVPLNEWRKAVKAARPKLEGRRTRSGQTPTSTPTKRPASALASSSKKTTPTSSNKRQRISLMDGPSSSQSRSAEVDALQNQVTPTKTRPTRSTGLQILTTPTKPSPTRSKAKAKATPHEVDAAAQLVIATEEAERQAEDRMILDEAEEAEQEARMVHETPLWDWELDPEHRFKAALDSFQEWKMARLSNRMELD